MEAKPGLRGYRKPYPWERQETAPASAPWDAYARVACTRIAAALAETDSVESLRERVAEALEFAGFNAGRPPHPAPIEREA